MLQSFRWLDVPYHEIVVHKKKHQFRTLRIFKLSKLFGAQTVHSRAVSTEVCGCTSAGAKETTRLLLKKKADVNVVATWWLKMYTYLKR